MLGLLMSDIWIIYANSTGLFTVSRNLLMHAWFSCLHKFFVGFGFEGYRKDNVRIFLLVDVDDMLIIKSNISFMHTIISGLNSRFSIRTIVYFLIPKTFNYHLLGSIERVATVFTIGKLEKKNLMKDSQKILHYCLLKENFCH